MSGLLLFLLLGLLAVYAVFFLFFKVIWKLCKKDRNKWPLILAGICTALLTACVIGAAVWGVYKVMEPLRPIQQRLAAHPQPIYGTRTYKDPVYPLSFQISDGMDFSEWISLSDVKVKLGINTNLFRKDAKGHSIKSPATFAVLVRRPLPAGEQNPFADIMEQVEKNGKPHLTVETSSLFTLQGRPAYRFAGQAASDQGTIPLWGTAFYQDGAVFYLIASEFDTSTNSAKLMADSLQPLVPLPTR